MTTLGALSKQTWSTITIVWVEETLCKVNSREHLKVEEGFFCHSSGSLALWVDSLDVWQHQLHLSFCTAWEEGDRAVQMFCYPYFQGSSFMKESSVACTLESTLPTIEQKLLYLFKKKVLACSLRDNRKITTEQQEEEM